MTKGVRDWPALMKPLTARAYLDNMPAAKFVALAVPHLDTRTTGGEVRFAPKSLDDWIDASGGPRATTRAPVARRSQTRPANASIPRSSRRSSPPASRQ